MNAQENVCRGWGLVFVRLEEQAYCLVGPADPKAAISGARLYPSIHALRAAVESLHKSKSRSWNSSGKESTATTTAVGSEAVEP